MDTHEGGPDRCVLCHTGPNLTLEWGNSTVEYITTVIPALWEVKVGRSPEVRSSSLAWPTWRNPIFTKNTKSSLAWSCVSVVLATREAEAGESVELGRQRLQ